MKTLCVPLLLLAGFLQAQMKNNSGLLIADSTPPVTRAVVIGISDYKEPLIPDLLYAHRDAQAFAEWLRSPAGGALPAENIRFRVNEQATNAEMIMSLDWLIDVSRPGDKAFVYFSGHGDVERVTKYSLGYLLGYDSPPAVYGAGAFSLEYLQAILRTLSENDVQVVMITDACRAGKLAGSSVNGAQVTASRLAQGFANEIKILSCQPDELSLEGVQWGGGRGCFSFHLENALYGFADQDDDQRVDLQELRRYLEDHVSREAEPQRQVPIVQGQARADIAQVDAVTLAARKAMHPGGSVEFRMVDNKGMENILIAGLDSNVQQLYARFEAAITDGRLMFPAGACADAYFDSLLAIPGMAPLYGSIKRQFVAALMEEGQGIINRLLQSDPETVDNIWAGKINYDHLPGYFGRAAEILGAVHYVYRDLKTKELYFAAMQIRKENYLDKTDSLIRVERRNLLNQALGFDSAAAYVYYELRTTCSDYTDPEYLSFQEKAGNLAPNWALINYELGRAYMMSGKSRESISCFLKAIALDTVFLRALNWVAWPYKSIGKPDSANYYSNLYVEKFYQKWNKNANAVTAYECNDAGNALWRLRRPVEARQALWLGEKKSGGRFHPIYGNLAAVYCELMEFDSAIAANHRTIELTEYDDSKINYNRNIADKYLHFKIDPDSSEYYYKKAFGASSLSLALCYFRSGKLGKAEEMLLQLLAQGRDTFADKKYLALIYTDTGRKVQADSIWASLLSDTALDQFHDYRLLAMCMLDRQEALETTLEAMQKQGRPKADLRFLLARNYALAGQPKKAVACLQEAFDLGFTPGPVAWITQTLFNPDFNKLRSDSGFKQLVAQHYPEQLPYVTRE